MAKYSSMSTRRATFLRSYKKCAQKEHLSEGARAKVDQREDFVALHAEQMSFPWPPSDTPYVSDLPTVLIAKFFRRIPGI